MFMPNPITLDRYWSSIIQRLACLPRAGDALMMDGGGKSANAGGHSRRLLLLRVKLRGSQA